MTPSSGDRAAARRRATYLAGHWAERFAAAALIVKGYRILARRYIVRGGEIDIVAKRGSTVAFVEVKARGSEADALAALTAQKRQRLERAAAAWLFRNAWATACTLRGDAILVVPRRWPRHIADAYTLRLG